MKYKKIKKIVYNNGTAYISLTQDEKMMLGIKDEIIFEFRKSVPKAVISAPKNTKKEGN